MILVKVVDIIEYDDNDDGDDDDEKFVTKRYLRIRVFRRGYTYVWSKIGVERQKNTKIILRLKKKNFFLCILPLCLNVETKQKSLRGIHFLI